MAAENLNSHPYRANGQLAYHVLEAVHGFHDSTETKTETGTFYNMQSSCENPEPFPVDYHFI